MERELIEYINNRINSLKSIQYSRNEAQALIVEGKIDELKMLLKEVNG